MKILLLLILSHATLALETPHYSIVTPAGWTEVPGIYGLDALLTTPLEGTARPSALVLQTFEKNMLPSKVPDLLLKELERQAKKEKFDFKVKLESTIGLRSEKIYLLEATIEGRQKSELLLFGMAFQKKLLFGHFEAPAADYEKYQQQLRAALAKLTFPAEKE